MTVIDDANPSLVTEGSEIWHLPSFIVAMVDDVPFYREPEMLLKCPIMHEPTVVPLCWEPVAIPLYRELVILLNVLLCQETSNFDVGLSRVWQC